MSGEPAAGGAELLAAAEEIIAAAAAAGATVRLLGGGQAEAVAHGADQLAQVMAAAPKSVRWKMRARVGEKVTWYELPEETS